MELVMSGNYDSKSIIRFAGDYRNGAAPECFTGADLELLTNNDIVWVEIYEDATHQVIKVEAAR